MLHFQMPAEPPAHPYDVHDAPVVVSPCTPTATATAKEDCDAPIRHCCHCCHCRHSSGVTGVQDGEEEEAASWRTLTQDPIVSTARTFTWSHSPFFPRGAGDYEARQLATAAAHPYHGATACVSHEVVVQQDVPLWPTRSRRTRSASVTSTTSTAIPSDLPRPPPRRPAPPPVGAMLSQLRQFGDVWVDAAAPLTPTPDDGPSRRRQTPRTRMSSAPDVVSHGFVQLSQKPSSETSSCVSTPSVVLSPQSCSGLYVYLGQTGRVDRPPTAPAMAVAMTSDVVVSPATPAVKDYPPPPQLPRRLSSSSSSSSSSEAEDNAPPPRGRDDATLQRLIAAVERARARSAKSR